MALGTRITLTREDVELIIAALLHLHKSSIVNEAVYKEYGVASRQRINQIQRKLGVNTSAHPNTPHPKGEV